MKKRMLIKGIIIFFTIYFLLMLFSCFEFETFENPFELGRFEEHGLDIETEKQILNDSVKYLNKINKTREIKYKNIAIFDYYGVYQKNIIIELVLIGFAYHTEVVSYCVAGILFFDTPVSPYIIWNTENVYNLKDAWESGLYNKDDIQFIAEMIYEGLDIPLCPGCKNCNNDSED